MFTALRRDIFGGHKRSQELAPGSKSEHGALADDAARAVQSSDISGWRLVPAADRRSAQGNRK
jgi:hypothetical protein